MTRCGSAYPSPCGRWHTAVALWPRNMRPGSSCAAPWGALPGTTPPLASTSTVSSVSTCCPSGPVLDWRWNRCTTDSRRPRCDQARLVGHHHQLRAVARVELGHDAADMGLRRRRTEEEILGYLVVAL